MSALNSAEKLTEHFLDAVYQRRLMEPWLNNRKFENAGGTLIYSVDTDTIKLYTNPVQESVGTEQRSAGYARVFRDDPEELSIALGYSLAHHIFHDLTKDNIPLLIMPPLEREVGRVFAAVTRDADQEHKIARKEIENLKTIIADLKKQQNEQDILERLTADIPRLTEILLGIIGPSAELRRFGKLFSEAWIASPEYIINLTSKCRPEVRRVLAPIDNLEELIRYLNMKASWRDRLQDTKSHVLHKDTVEDDADALGRLEWMNSQLDQKRFRIVHITGDQSILRAAVNYKIPFDKGLSFADLYLLHPRAFLGELRRQLHPDPVHPDPETEGGSETDNDFLNMLNVFLGKLPLDGPENIEHLEAVLASPKSDLEASVKPVLKTHPTIVSDFQTTWKSYIENFATHHIPYELTIIDCGIPANLSGDLEKIIGNIEEQLEARIDETWAACFAAVIRTGFDILAFQKDGFRTRARNISPLYFDSLPKTQKFVQTMQASQKEGVLNAESYKNALDALAEEDKGSKYLYNLAYAFLFAVVGRWHIAVILSDRAVRIAKDCGIEHFSGREANYLKAMALRHSAKSIKDLDAVMPALDEAYRCLKQDQEDRPTLNIWPIRYAIEKPALYLTHYLFDRFYEQDSSRPPRTLLEIQKELEQYLHSVREITNSWMCRNVERNLLTNLFMVVFLRTFGDKEPLETDALNPFLKQFSANINSKDEPKIEVSFLVDCIFSIASWWLEKNSTEKRKIREDILTKMSVDDISNASVLPYDRERFKFLRRIVE